jgi:hypothetical protein
LNESQRAYYPSTASNRWLATRLEFIGNAIVLMAAVFGVTSHDANAGLVGLSVTYALSITQTLNWMVRQSSEIETNIVSVERIKEYIEIQHERQDWQLEVPNSWPEHGTIEFKNYGTAYREGLSLVLHVCNFLFSSFAFFLFLFLLMLFLLLTLLSYYLTFIFEIGHLLQSSTKREGWNRGQNRSRKGLSLSSSPSLTCFLLPSSHFSFSFSPSRFPTSFSFSFTFSFS